MLVLVLLLRAMLSWDWNTWQLVGGQGVRGSWAADTFENVFALTEMEI